MRVYVRKMIAVDGCLTCGGIVKPEFEFECTCPEQLPLFEGEGPRKKVECPSTIKHIDDTTVRQLKSMFSEIDKGVRGVLSDGE